MLVFQGKIKPPTYKLSTPVKMEQMYVKADTAKIRPYVCCATIRNIKLSHEAYNSFWICKINYIKTYVVIH